MKNGELRGNYDNTKENQAPVNIPVYVTPKRFGSPEVKNVDFKIVVFNSIQFKLY